MHVPLVIGLSVGIPVTFLLTAIISSLLTLLITYKYQCLPRRKSDKLKPAAAVYDHVSLSNCSLTSNSYDAVASKNDKILHEPGEKWNTSYEFQK